MRERHGIPPVTYYTWRLGQRKGVPTYTMATAPREYATHPGTAATAGTHRTDRSSTRPGRFTRQGHKSRRAVECPISSTTRGPLPSVPSTLGGIRNPTLWLLRRSTLLSVSAIVPCVSTVARPTSTIIRPIDLTLQFCQRRLETLLQKLLQIHSGIR